jgi:putative peptidoglycan lipid II flippase
MSRLTKTTLMLAMFFALDKGLALLRQVIIARQFGFSPELDAFNVANNLPDLIYALISGGALAIAFIPVLTESFTQKGRQEAWDLFSRIANLVFLVTAGLAVITALLAEPIVKAEIGIAPGFSAEQQALVTHLMRVNLIALLIFSISGLVSAGLQSNQHFFLPALAPIMYNLGQIFGALVLAPERGLEIAGITLPAMGMGVQGLVVGVIIGAALHLLIQVPGLVRFKFRWLPAIGLRNPEVIKVLKLLGPRLVTMLFIQLIFIVRDNLASRLGQVGAVTALTYGWMLMQVPETLIGTAIGTAMLPTLAEHAAKQEWDAFYATIQRAIRVLLALALPVSAVMAVAIGPLLSQIFKLDAPTTDLLLWTTRGFLVGVIGHCMMEVAARSFYARQNALIPMFTAMVNFVVYLTLAVVLVSLLGTPGISIADSAAFITQAVVLLILQGRKLGKSLKPGSTLWRAPLTTIIGMGAALLIVTVIGGAVGSVLAMGVGVAVALPLVLPELKLLLRL